MSLIERGYEKDLPQLNLSLAMPNRKTIAKLKHINNRKLTFKYGQISELTFSLPYEAVIRNALRRNPHIDNIKEKFFIKATLRNIEEWFLITKIEKSATDSDSMTVQCFSLAYQLRYQKMVDYIGKSLNCLEVATDCLKGTAWTVGYINPDFNLKYRQFDVSSKTKLEFIYEIAETFEGTIVFDTVNNKVNICKDDEISNYKGFWITYGKYLENIQETIDSDAIVTRLYVKGNNNLTINSINPTGQSYIDDFSYYLYPFEMDENGVVISHSKYMSDELSIAIVKYNAHMSSLKGDFSGYLAEKKELQSEKTIEENTLRVLKSDLQIIEDNLRIARDESRPIEKIIAERDSKLREITIQENSVAVLNNSLSQVENRINELKRELNMDNFLTPELSHELINFIHRDDWTDENQIDEHDLYEAALDRMSEINSPPIDIKMSLVNFLAMITESHNWGKINIGDVIKIKHDKLNIFVQARIAEIVLSFDDASIDLTISNAKEINNTVNKYKKAFYTINKNDTDYNARKVNWDSVTRNFNSRNDRIKETPINPDGLLLTHDNNDNASVNLTISWVYPDFNETKKNEHNIDGFLLYLYSSDSNEEYIFGSQMAKETKVDLISEVRIYTFPSVPSNKNYSFGVRAYRRVDEDINTDGIILSDIVSTGKPYQPDPRVNFKGSLNGVQYTVNKTEPADPVTDDIWINPIDAKTRVYDGVQWKVANYGQESNDYTDIVLGRTEEELKKKIEDAMSEVDEAMKKVESEMERIEKEVVPDVERAIRETYIPRQNTPPTEIGSGLWWDTSFEPPRFMRYDEVTGQWIPVAPDSAEFEEILQTVKDKMLEVDEAMKIVDSEMERIKTEVIPEIEQAVKDTYIPKQDIPPSPDEYTLWWNTSVDPPRFTQWDAEKQVWTPVAPTQSEIDQLIQDARDGIAIDYRQYTEDEILAMESKLINQLNSEIGDVNGAIDSLVSRTNGIDGTLTNISQNISTLDGQITTTISQLTNLDGVVSDHTLTLNMLPGQLQTKAEKSEVYTRTQTDGLLGDKVDFSIYSNKMTNLDLSISGINGKVSNVETTINTLTGEIGSAKSQIAEIDLKADGIRQSVSEVRADFDNLEIGGRNLLRNSETFTGWQILAASLGEVANSSANPSYSYNSAEFTTSIASGVGISSPFAPVSTGFQYTAQAFIQRTQGNTDSFILSVLAYDKNKTILTEQVLTLDNSVVGSSKGSYVESYSGLLVYGDNISNLMWGVFTVTDSRVAYVRVRAGVYRGTYTTRVNVSDVMLSKGNKAIGWAPASEDVDARITSAETLIEQKADRLALTAVSTSVDSLTGRMSKAETTLNLLPGQLEAKIEKDGVIGAINATPELLQIDFAKVNINAMTEFAPMSRNYHRATSIANGTAGKWYRIATNAGSRAHGRFILKDITSSQHNTAVFEAGVNYNSSPYINLTSYGNYSAHSFTSIRMLTNGTYDDVYLDVFINNNARVQSLEYWITDNIQDSGWVPVNWVVATIPSGYKAFTRSIDSDSVVQGTVDKWKYGNTTLINGGEIYTNTITAAKLNVNEIFGNSAVIAKIRADAILTTDLSATKITTGTLNASIVSVINLSATNINTGTLNASLVNVSNLNATNITSGTLNVARIGASSITVDKLNINNIFGNSAIIAKIQSDSVLTANLSATKITTGTLNAAQVSVVNLSATSIISGTLDALKVNVANLNASNIVSGTLDANKINVINLKASTITVGEGTTFADGYDPTKLPYGNLVNNPAVTGNTLGWSTSGVLTTVQQNFQGVSATVLQSSSAANVIHYSDWFNVDPSKAYEVSFWFKKSATIGRVYLGLHASDGGDINNVGFERVNAAGTVTNQNDGNFYFWYPSNGGSPTSWIKITGYIMPSGTAPSDMKGIGTDANAIMKPNLTKVRIRFLNYENETTARQLWVANPKVVEVDPNAVIRGTLAKDMVDGWKYGNTTYINGGSIYANSITATQIKVDNLSALTANLGNVTAGSISGITVDASVIYTNGLDHQYLYANAIDVNPKTNAAHVYVRPSASIGALKVTATGSTTIYRPVEALGYIGNYLAVNDSGGQVNINLEIGTKGTGEVRITDFLSGSTYKNLRASFLFADALDVNGHGNATHLYLRPTSAGEVRATATGTTGNYVPMRASVFTSQGNGIFESSAGYVILRSSGQDIVYLQTNGHVRATRIGQTSTYIPISALSFDAQSTEKSKQDIKVWEESALDVINSATLHQYRMKSEVQDGIERVRHGLVIGEGYNTPQSIISQSGEAIDQYEMNSWGWKAIQELSKIQDVSADEMNWLKMENQLLRGRVKRLEGIVLQEG